MTGDINLPFKINNIYRTLELDYSLRWNSTTLGTNKKIIPLENTTNFVLSDYILDSNGDIKLFTWVNKNICFCQWSKVNAE